ncbi:hypothetical protein E2562_007811, partial [Oryza meyeriana var. granulata]
MAVAGERAKISRAEEDTVAMRARASRFGRAKTGGKDKRERTHFPPAIWSSPPSAPLPTGRAPPARRSPPAGRPPPRRSCSSPSDALLPAGLLVPAGAPLLRSRLEAPPRRRTPPAPRMSTTQGLPAPETETETKGANVLKRNSDDVRWEYGVLVDPANKDKVKCKLCDKVMQGGIYRLKQHVAHEGKNATKCKARIPQALEAKEKCKKALDDAKRKREEKTFRELELREEVNVSRAKRQIKEAFGNMESRFKEVIAVVDKKMKVRLDSPLHLTAYLLNPHYSYANPSIFDDSTIVEGFISCVETFYYHDEDKQDQAFNTELKKFQIREGPFNKKLARTFENFDYNPASWWRLYGTETLALQKMATRILSLTSSSSGCERNWSGFEG